MKINSYFDTRTSTITYLVWDPQTRDAFIIDPVLDFDAVDNRVWQESIDLVDADITTLKLNLKLILETHAHADHLSGSQELKKRHPSAKIGIGSKINLIQETFKPVFELGDWFKTDGSQFDILIEDNQILQAGSLAIKAIPTPGHTPACMSFALEDSVFVGDAIFMPDSGTGRCDFPAGSADSLYQSVRNNLYTLPDETRVFVGHDYQPEGRELRYESTIGAEKAANIQLKDGTSKQDFIAFRQKRDEGLNKPKLLFQSIQVNIDAGHLPEGSSSNKAVLRSPASS